MSILLLSIINSLERNATSNEVFSASKQCHGKLENKLEIEV